MTSQFLKPETTSRRSAERSPKITTCYGIVAVAVLLAGCGSSGPTQPVAFYVPAGPTGEASCEISKHCVIQTGTGKVYVSIGEQSAIMIGFADVGGNMEHYFDYLVTVQNLGENDLFFDPRKISGYDPSARLAVISEQEERLKTLGMLAGLQAALGGSVNAANLEHMSAVARRDRTVAESQLQNQQLVAQTIPPGEQAVGRITVRSDGQAHEHLEVSIPVGTDYHIVRFIKRGKLPRVTPQQLANLPDLPADFSFDGRWFAFNDNNSGVCDIRTQERSIHMICDDSISELEGTIEGRTAKFFLESLGTSIELTAVEQNILFWRRQHWTGNLEYIYERM